jgi:predicted nucleic acid-binding protein
MRPSVFVDAAAWIALNNRRDEHHGASTALLVELRRRRLGLLTTEFVLVEVANSLSRPETRSLAIEFLDGLRRDPDLRVEPASTELFAAGWSLYSARPDKAWGLTDCISSITMQREGITRAFTSDHHFVQAGFVKLL